MRRLITIFSTALLLALVPAVVLGYPPPSEPTGFVNDYANILTESTDATLEKTLSDFEQRTGNEIAVLTVPSLEGEPIENVAITVFETWGIGKKGTDNGVLLLVAPNDREMRIEVGYGLEPTLTDAKSGQIIDKILLPAFRVEDYDSGVNNAVEEIMLTIQGEGTLPAVTQEQEFSSMDDLFNKATLFFFLVVWIISILGRTKSWWLGGIMGGIIGIIVTMIKGFFFIGLVSLVGLVLIGLLIDYVVSKKYTESMRRGSTPPWWVGGGGKNGSGFGGFGGFGGGRSGGGGASGRW